MGVAGRAAKPTSPNWSNSIETSICPAIESEMKVAAPSLGASVAAAVTKTAPSKPPTHTHQGDEASALHAGSGVRSAAQYAKRPSAPTANETSAAAGVLPTQHECLAFIPACNGI